ncbi:MAG TPA: site-2 protease family protein [Actinobacteria bacterium]|nr:site-2 protease family protein [Actinomycetota bacterium]
MLTRRHLRIGRIAGIPVELDLSWFLVVVLLSWSFAAGFYPTSAPGASPIAYWVAGTATALLLFASVLVHELAHSLVARSVGVPVRRITLFIFGGVSELAREPRRGSHALWIALVGPASSLVLAGLLFLVRPAFGWSRLALALVSYLALINLMLGLFNLIPGFPLDGGNVLRAVLWQRWRDPRRATIVAANIGRFVAYLFVAFGLWLAFTGAIYDGLWIMFIGWFLESAAVTQIQQLHLRDLLEHERVADWMNPSYAYLPADTTLGELAAWHVLGVDDRVFVVRDGDRAIGITSRARFEEVPPERWATTTVAEVMVPVEAATTLRVDDDLWTAVEHLEEAEADRVLVVAGDGHVVGTFSTDDVNRALRALSRGWSLRRTASSG